MARMGVQYEDVVEAALQLQKQGDNPTLQRIRDWLGSGSFTTISEHLKQWRENQRNATPLQQEIQELPASLVNLVQQIWQQACLEADEKLQSYQQQADAEIRQALADKQTALEDALRIEEKSLLIDKKNNELLADMKQQTAQLSRLDVQLENTSEELARLKVASQANQETAKEKIEGLEKALEKQQLKEQLAIDELKEEQQIALAHEQQRNEENQLRWMQEVDSARQQALAIKETAAEEAKQAKRLIQEQQIALKASQEKNQQQILSLQANQIRTENLLKQQAQLEERNQRLEADIEEKQTLWLAKLEALNSELVNKNQQINELKTALASANRLAPLIMV